MILVPNGTVSSASCRSEKSQAEGQTVTVVDVAGIPVSTVWRGTVGRVATNVALTVVAADMVTVHVAVQGTPGDDAEGRGGGHGPRDGPTDRVLHREGLLREGPQIHTPEIHGVGRAHGKLAPRDITYHRSRTGALITARVHRGHRNIVAGAREKAREPEGDQLGDRRIWRQRWHLKRRDPRTGRVRDPIV